MNYKIASLMLNSQTNQAVGEVFISQPSAEKERLAGKMFILAEVKNSPDGIKIIDFLLNNITHNYYNNEKIILRERLVNLKIEHIFESSLAKSNKDLLDFLQREKIKFSSQDLNFTVGVLEKEAIHFSATGKNKATLVYRHKEDIKYKGQKTGQSKVSYKTANIEGEKNQRTDSQTEKIFSNVVSGSIPRKGYFIFSNETLPEYLTSKQIIEIVTKLQPAGAAEQMKNSLQAVNSRVPFLGVIIKNTEGLEESQETEQEKKPAKVSVDESISELNSSEEKTEKMLSPSGIINYRRWVSFSVLIIKKIKKSSQKQINKNLAIKEKIFFKKKPSFLSIEKIKNFAKSFFVYLGGAVSYFFKIIFDSKTRKSFLAKFKNFFSWLNSLNIKNKIILSASALLLIIFFISLGWTGKQNEIKETREQISSIKTEIDKKQNQIEAHLLYNNQEEAKKILRETDELLLELKNFSNENNEDFDTEYEKYAQAHEEQLRQIRKVVKPDFQELTDFSDLTNTADSSGIVLRGSVIYSPDRKNGQIYKYDLGNSSSLAMSPNQNLSNIKDTAIDDAGNIYILSQNSIAKMDEQENLKTYQIQENAVAVAGFGSRIYTADQEQIYRYDRAADGLDSRSVWLATTENPGKVADLSIDGYIYTLSPNGQIKRYLKGEEDPILMDSVEPGITSAEKIIAREDSDYIYILEPAEKRIIVFDKEGLFLLQYKTDEWNDLRDFEVINDSDVYVLNGSEILFFEINDLE